MHFWISIAQLIALAASLASAEDSHALALEYAGQIDVVRATPCEDVAGLIEDFDRIGPR
ncbi:MAG: hypothetical protein AAFX10_01795 [Pseudomonadota bacterium]